MGGHRANGATEWQIGKIRYEATSQVDSKNAT